MASRGNDVKRSLSARSQKSYHLCDDYTVIEKENLPEFTSSQDHGVDEVYYSFIDFGSPQTKDKSTRPKKMFGLFNRKNTSSQKIKDFYLEKSFSTPNLSNPPDDTGSMLTNPPLPPPQTVSFGKQKSSLSPAAASRPVIYFGLEDIWDGSEDPRRGVTSNDVKIAIGTKGVLVSVLSGLVDAPVEVYPESDDEALPYDTESLSKYHPKLPVQ